MKVWIVVDIEDHVIFGVFSSFDKAVETFYDYETRLDGEPRFAIEDMRQMIVENGGYSFFRFAEVPLDEEFGYRDDFYPLEGTFPYIK